MSYKGQSNEGFGGLGKDYDGHAMQTATHFGTVDATPTTPLVSPLTYTGSVTTLNVPNNAVQLILAPSTALRVSEDPAMASYYVIPSGACEAFSVTLLTTVYIKQDSAGGTVSFRFTEV